MRRFFFGIVILGLGTLFALPFRRSPDSKDAAHASSSTASNRRHPMELGDLDLLVQEITEHAQVPVVFHPHTDYTPPTPAPTTNTTPLTYEELAVPVAADPFYAERFNAAAEVASEGRVSEGRVSEGRVSEARASANAKRIEELRRRFASKKSVDSSESRIPDSLRTQQSISSSKVVRAKRPVRIGSGKTVKTAKLASAANESVDVRVNSADESPEALVDHSVLTQLPAQAADAQARKPQWILQPE